MSIKELLDKAIKLDYVDLQALIMFLVFEKCVLAMSDNTKELDIYFLEKHNKRMNKELMAYKKKMNMNYGLQVYKLALSDHKFIYVLSKSVAQAKLIASRKNIDYNKAEFSLDEMMHHNNQDMPMREVIKDKQVGILGGL